MPCFDGGPSTESVLKEKLDKVTDMLCRVLTVIETININGWVPLPVDIQIWWLKHKEADESRISKDKKDQEYQEKLRAWESQKPKRE